MNETRLATPTLRDRYYELCELPASQPLQEELAKLDPIFGWITLNLNQLRAQLKAEFDQLEYCINQYNLNADNQNLRTHYDSQIKTHTEYITELENRIQEHESHTE